MQVTTKQITNAAYLISLEGELGVPEVRMLEARLAAFLERGGLEVVLDLSSVGFVDSLLVRLLARLTKCLRATGGDLILASRNRQSDACLIKPFDLDRPERMRGLHAGLDRAIDGRLPRVAAV